MFEFKLPDLGEGIQEGEILKWYVEKGEEIQEDEPLVDVETDKAAVTIPSPRSGKIAERKGEVGDMVNVGDVFVVIDDGSGETVVGSGGGDAEKKQKTEAGDDSKEKDDSGKEAKKAEERSGSEQKAKDDSKASARPAERKEGRPVPAAPATRRLAREMDIDINQVPGTGPAGRITPEDVKAFAEGGGEEKKETEKAEEAAPARERKVVDIPSSGIPLLELEDLPDFSQQGPVEVEQFRSIRRKVAKKMVTSMVLVPHVAHMDEADVTELDNLRLVEKKKHEKGEPGSRLTLLPFVMKALTAMLRKYPQFNASLDPYREEVIYKKYYNIGFAADTPRGLMVPVVKGTNNKSILEISSEIVELAFKAKDGEIEPKDIQHGTISITNVGPIGGTGLIPTINYPEVAILGMARVQEKPVVRDGEIVIRKMLPLTFTFDHRIADGAQAAYMVTEMVKMLENPTQLLLGV